MPETLDQITYNEQGIPIRWVVQAASYREKSNAEKFRKVLNQGGFPVIIRQVETGDNLFHVVYAGPVLRRSIAEGYKDKIDKNL